MASPIYEVFTDGACSGNPGPGGWAYMMNGHIESGWLKQTTNNQMELMAVLNVLMDAPTGSRLVIHTDSQCVIGWLVKGWKTKNPHIAQLVQAIRETALEKKISSKMVHVNGHSGVWSNELVDQAAKAAVKKAKASLASQAR